MNVNVTYGLSSFYPLSLNLLPSMNNYMGMIIYLLCLFKEKESLIYYVADCVVSALDFYSVYLS